MALPKAWTARVAETLESMPPEVAMMALVNLVCLKVFLIKALRRRVSGAGLRKGSNISISE